AIRFSVGYQNAASAFRRLVAAGSEAERLLSDSQRRTGHFQTKLSACGLRVMADTEINRLGLLPFHAGGISAPGTDPRHVNLAFRECPQNLPSLEAEIRRLTALLLPAPAETQEREEAAGLPKVAAAAKGHPAATSAAPKSNCNTEEIAQ